MKPHELERLRSEIAAEKDSDATDDDEEMNGFDNVIQPIGSGSIPTADNGTSVMANDEFDELFQPKIEKSTPEKLFGNKSIHRDGENITINEDNTTYTVFQNIENALQTYDSLVVGSSSSTASGNNNNQIIAPTSSFTMITPSKSNTTRATTNNKKRAASAAQQNSRPKMIHTEKTRVPIIDGKRKSKTLITRTTSKSTASNTTTTKTASSSSRKRGNARKTTTSYNDNMYNKNLDETNLLLELSQNKFKFDPDVVNDLEEILRSPIKSKDNSYLEDYYATTPSSTHERTPTTRSSRRLTAGNRKLSPPQQQQYNSRSSTGKRQSNRKPILSPTSTTIQKMPAVVPINVDDIKEEVIDDIVDERITDEIEVYTCEMCSAVFRDRSQLLVHVPVHI